MARWSRPPSRIKKVVRRRFTQVRNDSAADLLDQYIQGTPVRDGWARGSIFVGDGTSPHRQSKSGSESYQAGVAAIEATPLYKKIRIRSTLSYIIRLEYGHSDQNQAFVRSAFENGKNTVLSHIRFNFVR